MTVAASLLVLALMLAVVLRYSASRLSNSDTWFHLTLGAHFRDDWSLSRPGALTPFATSPWVATQWSTEVVASFTESWFGLPGVAWLFGALYLAFVLAVYAVCRTRGAAVAAVVVTVLVVFASASALSARPQIVSLVLLTVTVHAWLRTWDDGRIRWWLVALTWVWATAHGLWSAGVLVGLVACVGLVLDRRAAGRRAVLMFAVPVASLLATALTPAGPRLLLAQLAVSERTPLIPEWGPTSFRSVPALAAALMLAAVVVLWTRRGGVAWTPLLLVLLAAGWILLVTRMVPLGAVVLAPLLVGAITEATRRTAPRPDRVEWAALVAVAVAYLAVLALVVPNTADEASGVPTAVEARLAALPAGSTVLVEDGTGAWIEWAVPAVHPVIDGMLDAYPVGYIDDFFAFTRVEPGWQDFVRRSGARDAVLLDGSPVSAALQDQLGWRVVQRDRDWVYLEAGRSQP